MKIERKEVLRYLGFQGVKAVDDTMDALISKCQSEMEKEITPRYIYRFFQIDWSDDGKEAAFAGIRTKGDSILRNLKGCSEIALMAVTLGPAPDRLVRKASIRGSLEPAIYQALGAAIVEAWCDEVNEMIRVDAAGRGLFLRPRYSPGYGDFPLDVQKDFERILEMPRQIGVTLTDSLLMVPTKSVTAVIGLSDIEENCIRSGCELCGARDTCNYAG